MIPLSLPSLGNINIKKKKILIYRYVVKFILKASLSLLELPSFQRNIKTKLEEKADKNIAAFQGISTSVKIFSKYMYQDSRLRFTALFREDLRIGKREDLRIRQS